MKSVRTALLIILTLCIFSCLGIIAPASAEENTQSHMASVSKQLPKFAQSFTIKLQSEKILDKTRGLKGLSSPQVSPDGKSIVFAAGAKDNHDLWLINTGDGSLVQLTKNNTDETDPSWMSDGKRIVYSSNASGIYQLYIMHKDGSGPKQITNDDVYNKLHPRCSPILWAQYLEKVIKEYTILYEAEKDGKKGIWVIGEDGIFPSPVNIPSEQGENYYQPEWSPNGLTCIYAHEKDGKTYISQGWGGMKYPGVGPIIKGVQTIAGSEGGGSPLYISNGTKLVFLNPGTDRKSLFYADVDGSNIKNLNLSRDIHGGVDWMPDGSAFVYITSVDGEECLAIQQVYYPLQDVSNLWQYSDYTQNRIDMLEKNRFVVLPKEHNLFNELYESYSLYYIFKEYTIPMFITVDTTLELYHLFFDYSLRTVEETQFLPTLTEFLNGCYTETSVLSKENSSKVMQEDISSTMEYFIVALNLLGDSPGTVNETVSGELALIEKSNGVSKSPVLGIKLDYSHFTVRGHYTRNDALKRYFQTMMWLGQAAFRAETPENPALSRIETRRALVLSYLIGNNQKLMNSWERLYQPINLFVGGADDFMVPYYLNIMKNVYTENTVAELYDDQKLDKFLEMVRKEKAPQIAPQDGRSFRLIPQRFTPDSYIHQNLLYEKVGTPANPRLLPRGLDIMAVLGSERAYEILDKVLGETKYENYNSQFSKLKTEFAQMKPSDWQKTVYGNWIYALMGLLPEYSDPYPPFMRNTAWKDKSLSTALASWTELRHDTIMYVKQSSAEAGEGGGGWEPVVPQPKGYVEPNPEFYSRLKNLIGTTYNSLESRNMLPDELLPKSKKFLEIITRLQSIAEKELQNISLSDDDYDFIRKYGTELEYLTIFFNEDKSLTAIGEGEISLIADVATDRLNRLILHEAVGKVREMDVIVPVNGRNQLNKGGVFSYYEFPVEGKRLNDDDWKQMLKEGKAPALPVWTSSFTAKD